MFRLFDRLIYKTLLKSTLFCGLLLIGLDGFFTLLSELDDVGKASYTLGEAISYVLLMMPGHLYGVFPLIALLGGIVGLNILASHRELTMMQLFGLSKRAIFFRVAVFALLMGVVVALLGELIVPAANQGGTFSRAIAKSGAQAYKTPGGVWMRNHDEFLHIKEVLPNGYLKGITLYEFNQDNQLKSVSFANEARFFNKEWHLNQVKTTKIGKQTIHAENSKQINWPIKINPTLFSVVMLTADDVSLVELSHYILYLKHNHLAFTEYAVSFYKRLLQPLATLVMFCLAVPLVFGVFRLQKTSFRLAAGFFLSFVFYLFNQFSLTLSMAYGVPALVSVLLPLVAFMLLGGYLVSRLR